MILALRLLALLHMAALIAAAFVEAGWMFEIAAHFLLSTALIAFVCGAALVALDRWGMGAAAIGLALIAAVRMAGADHMSPAGSASAAEAAPADSAGEESALLVWLNLHYDPAVLDRLAVLAGELEPDLIAISETPGVTLERLAALFPNLPYIVDAGAMADPDTRLVSRIVILSRRPLEKAQAISEPVFAGWPFLTAELATAGGPVTLIAAHPVPPFSGRHQAIRDAVIDAVADAAPADGRFVVMGDFNTTPWSNVFARLPGRRAGHPALESTWITRWPAAGLAIDHILLGPEVGLESYRVGPAVGSDHLPLIARVRWPEG